MKNYYRMLFVLLVALNSLLGINCNASTGFSSAIDSIISLDFPTIKVFLRVFTSEPQILTSDNFTLFERKDRIATFSIDVVKREPYVVVLLDRSSSVEPVINQIKNAAVNFVNTITGTTKTALMTFASDIDLVKDFVKDPAPLVDGIKKIRPWGGTALYDAIYQAAEQLRNAAQRDDQKTIVLLTDGKDESPQGTPGFSIKKPQEIFEHARKNNIRVIAVGLGTYLDVEFLKTLAKETKGAFLQAPTPEKLQSVFQAISKRMSLERRYSITYQTPDPRRDGTRRDLQIVSECRGVKDQGIGFYIAPVDSDKTKSETTSAGTTKLKIKNDLSLGRLKSPDLGSATPIGHIESTSLGTYTPIATLTVDHPAAKDGIDAANRAIEEVNRSNQKLFEKNQKEFDAQIDAANRVIDDANQMSEQLLEDSQDDVDKTIDETNKIMEELEKNESSEIDISIPEPDISDD